MFYGCSSLQAIPQFNTSKVWNMSNMFQGCASLQAVPQLDTSMVTDMNSMFNGCASLQAVPQLDTSMVTDMNAMFYGCTSLETIEHLDLTNTVSLDPNINDKFIYNTEFMFGECTSLRKCKLILHGIIDLYWSPLLENDSILYMIEHAKPLVSGVGTIPIKIYLHPDAYNRAIADESIQAALSEHSYVLLERN